MQSLGSSKNNSSESKINYKNFVTKERFINGLWNLAIVAGLFNGVWNVSDSLTSNNVFKNQLQRRDGLITLLVSTFLAGSKVVGTNIHKRQSFSDLSGQTKNLFTYLSGSGLKEEEAINLSNQFAAIFSSISDGSLGDTLQKLISSDSENRTADTKTDNSDEKESFISGLKNMYSDTKIANAIQKIPNHSNLKDFVELCEILKNIYIWEEGGVLTKLFRSKNDEYLDIKEELTIYQQKLYFLCSVHTDNVQLPKLLGIVSVLLKDKDSLQMAINYIKLLSPSLNPKGLIQNINPIVTKLEQLRNRIVE